MMKMKKKMQMKKKDAQKARKSGWEKEGNKKTMEV